mmetsp:Transcript_68503/g.112553  ORF Transcript_68503/g.112553 Transcript_68503/m.112553 type:complete len:371 (-) Transcript_68503:154-1266(-)
MKSFLVLAVPFVAAYNCPSSSSSIHASCRVTVAADVPCEQVQAEMKARVDGQSAGLWHDPHNNGTYSLIDSDKDVLDFQRVTGNKKYTDKLRFDFKDIGNKCEISACSASQVFSIGDFSTNYCNLRMLYCSSQDGCHPVKFDFNAKETDVEPSLGAGKTPSDCLKMTEVSQDFLAPTQCPPAGFDTVQDFDLEKFIEKRWYIQQQMAVNYLPASQNRCVYAEYQLREKSFWGYDVSVHNHAEEVAAPHKVHDSGKTLCAKVVDKARGKLEVAPCFLPTLAAGPYWVLDYSEGPEGYALISGGAPKESGEAGCRTGTGTNGAGLWIFTRQQKRDEALVQKVRGIAKSKGFDLSVLNDVDQSECSEAVALAI